MASSPATASSRERFKGSQAATANTVNMVELTAKIKEVVIRSMRNSCRLRASIMRFVGLDLVNRQVEMYNG